MTAVVEMSKYMVCGAASAVVRSSRTNIRDSGVHAVDHELPCWRMPLCLPYYACLRSPRYALQIVHTYQSRVSDQMLMLIA